MKQKEPKSQTAASCFKYRFKELYVTCDGLPGFCMNIYVSLTVNCNIFGDQLTFHLASSSGTKYLQN